MPKVVATREAWLDLGLQRFSEGGASALVVERLARSLGTSKSSFYWYLNNREGFLYEVLQYWVRLGTTAVIDQSEIAPTAAGRLYKVMFEALSSRAGGDFLFHLRALAQRDPMAAQLLEITEAARIGYLAQVLGEMGHDPKTARCTADLVYHYFLGWYERHKHRVPTEGEVEAVIADLGRVCPALHLLAPVSSL